MFAMLTMAVMGQFWAPFGCSPIDLGQWEVQALVHDRHGEVLITLEPMPSGYLEGKRYVETGTLSGRELEATYHVRLLDGTQSPELRKVTSQGVDSGWYSPGRPDTVGCQDASLSGPPAEPAEGRADWAGVRWPWSNNRRDDLRIDWVHRPLN